MATLARLKATAQEVVAEFFERCREAEVHRAVELKSARVIQSYARGFLIRRRLDRLRDVAITIQRYWRGYMGSLRAKLAQQARDKRLRQEFFNTKATVISRHWRGFWSRRHLFDFYARKRYLQQVQEKNSEIRLELEQEASRARELQRVAAEAQARKMFESRVGNLHHLVSTAQQPGIFNSPYALATNTVPLVMGLPLEEHLKSTFKTQAPQRLPPIKKVPKKLTGPLAVYSRDVTMAGHTYLPHITLQQAAGYEAVRQAGVLEEKVHRAEMLSVHTLPFAASLTRPFHPPVDPQSNRNVEHYITPHDPTIGRKTDSFTPEMKKVSGKMFEKYPHKQPFFDPLLHKESY